MQLPLELKVKLSKQEQLVRPKSETKQIPPIPHGLAISQGFSVKYNMEVMMLLNLNIKLVIRQDVKFKYDGKSCLLFLQISHVPSE